MIIKQDTKQSIKSTFKFFIEFYKILIGSFLTLTVPKYCGNSNSISNSNSSSSYSNLNNSCTIMNNIADNNVFHQFALYTNAISFIIFIIMYGIEIKREKWCINYLDQDINKSITNLDLEIEKYPNLKNQMYYINKNYALITKICILSQFINITISTIDISYKWYGFKSFTPFTSYIIVIFMKLYNSYYISSESLLYERAYSSFLTEPIIFNTIDKDYNIKLNNTLSNEKNIVELNEITI